MKSNCSTKKIQRKFLQLALVNKLKKEQFILHIPHSSRLIPEEYREDFLISEEMLNKELLIMTDAFTDELFALKGIEKLVFPVSRLLVDPERFADDSVEQMAEVGMGVIYTRTSSGKKLKKDYAPEQRERLLKRYYFSHHEKLTQKVEETLKNFNKCLVIDCHSFSSVPLSHEPDQNPNRPDICIGTDKFHTSEDLSKKLQVACKNTGLKSKFNSPFSGSLVPTKLYQKDARVQSIMIEVNRKLYMNEKTGEKTQNFNDFKQTLALIVKNLLA
jgi:N-formylglutamate amidohydrolase